MYTIFKCKSCNKEIILLTEEVMDSQFKRQYISCSHCGSKKLRKEKATDNLKECMKERKYKREHGALKQI